MFMASSSSRQVPSTYNLSWYKSNHKIKKIKVQIKAVSLFGKAFAYYDLIFQ